MSAVGLDMGLLDLLGLLNLRVLSLRDVMDELASHAVGAPSVGAELLAEFCLVEDRHICFYHHVSSSMSERAL